MRTGHDPLRASAAGKDHAFEAWFRSSADYDQQAADRSASPARSAATTKVEKALMAPSIGRAGKDKGGGPAPAPATRGFGAAAERRCSLPPTRASRR